MSDTTPTRAKWRLWFWLADRGAPEWLWSRFVAATWKPCATCGWRGRGKWKPACSYGGGHAPRHYCSKDHYYAKEWLGAFHSDPTAEGA